MKTAEEILDQHCDSLPAWTGNRKQAVINAINAARKDAIEECLKEAKIEQRKWRNELVGSEKMWSYKDNAYLIDQHSILKLIDELK